MKQGFGETRTPPWKWKLTLAVAVVALAVMVAKRVGSARIGRPEDLRPRSQVADDRCHGIGGGECGPGGTCSNEGTLERHLRFSDLRGHRNGSAVGEGLIGSETALTPSSSGLDKRNTP